MTPEEVEALLGSPEKVRTNRSHERDERRRGTTIRYSKSSGRVVEVEMEENVRPIIEGLDVFAATNPLAELKALDAEAYECFGTAVFLTLGVSASMHIGSGEAGATVSAFARGRWGRLRVDFKPLSDVAGV